MAPSSIVRVLLVAAAVLASSAACNRGSDEVKDGGQSAMDTTNKDALDGMPARDVQEQARPLSQEQAAQQGLITDTTVNVGDPGRDSIPGAPQADPGASRAPAETTGAVAAPQP